MPEITCPHCQAEMTHDDDSIFCHKCGLLLKINWVLESAMELKTEKMVTKMKITEDRITQIGEVTKRPSIQEREPIDDHSE
jgi:predicted amidophosphoribosyltransferase